jgi:hypothetical protein
MIHFYYFNLFKFIKPNNERDLKKNEFNLNAWLYIGELVKMFKSPTNIALNFVVDGVTC